jgi:serine/threonine-protein kinase
MGPANDDKTLLSADFARAAPESHRVSRVVAPPTLLASDRFIECELIGRGGMGSVIRAFDRNLERDVAIKVLAPESAASESAVERLRQEARITGLLEHPHILPVYEFGTDDRGARFLCMKLVQGETLEDTLAWAGPSRLEPEFLADLLVVFAKVCDAVAFAHSRGVLHRDLKPSNVMVGDFGQVYVLDWGVARLTPPASAGQQGSQRTARSAGLLEGTPRYMAPEQLYGLSDELDERTDVFALGATLYQILTGQPPHDAESLPHIALHRCAISIPPPESVVQGAFVPAELSRIALKAMAYDPRDRYPSVLELKNDVERFQRGSWHLPRRWFSAGSLILAEGEPGESAYIIVEGRCVAFDGDDGGEVVLREMGPGDVFGEMAIIANGPRTASVRAATDVIAMVVNRETLTSALGLHQWIGCFVRALAERFRELDRRARTRRIRHCTGRP